MSETVVKLTDVWKVFGTRADEAMAAIKAQGLTKPEVLEQFGCVVGVQAATFDVPRGEIFCIMGLSGSGKSTLVRHVNRLIEPTSGSIEILGSDVGAINRLTWRTRVDLPDPDSPMMQKISPRGTSKVAA